MDLYPFQEIIPVSALKDDNLDTLLKVIKSYLKEGICYYGKEDVFYCKECAKKHGLE